ncbi:MAG: DNA/RNA nuclease SfsA [Gemmatimonadota bacterium]
MRPAPRVTWGAPLVEARFLARPNRFVVHAEVNGREEVAHLADPGRLRELLVPGARLGLRPEPPSPTRKTRWTAMLVEVPGDEAGGMRDRRGGGNAADEPGARPWVSVNTTVPNRLVEEGLRSSLLEEFAGWSFLRREPPLGKGRMDFLLENGEGRRMYVETKSVTLVRDGVALFPDAVTARGARHLEELEKALGEGHEAAVLFIVQRPDAERIVAAREIDPHFARTLSRVQDAGVRVLGRRCRVDWEGITLLGPVPAGAG